MEKVIEQYLIGVSEKLFRNLGGHSMLIRRFIESDHDEVWQLHNDGLNQMGVNLGNGKWDEDLHNIESVYINNRGDFLVGELDGQIIAMGALRKISDTAAEIKRMRVHPDFQGKGYGQKIYDSLEAKAIQLGYTKLSLDTTVKQFPAQKLYDKNGFVEVGRRNIKGLELIFYEKTL
jgi:ribosomal protein S18 acetylase RimI-like enzyme